MKPVYKPSRVMRLMKKGVIAHQQPKGEGIIRCEAKGHVIHGETESPTFWENGMYVWCEGCQRKALARVEFREFIIDLTGERKSYPLYAE